MINLKIISPVSKTEHQVVWLEANTPEGNFVIQPDHIPTTLVLSAGKDFMYCFQTGKHETIIPERGGILHVTRTEATVLLS
ncbi:MAG: F0F1-type ATP synthase epsilon subunit [Alteromonas naphthalenivorans]|jgi:F0F1-type ATP synthase epsilon subunit